MSSQQISNKKKKVKQAKLILRKARQEAPRLRDQHLKDAMIQETKNLQKHATASNNNLAAGIKMRNAREKLKSSFKRIQSVMGKEKAEV